MGVQLSTSEAYRLVDRGVQVFAVNVNRKVTLFRDEDAAYELADEHDVRVLDWETGDYA